MRHHANRCRTNNKQNDFGFGFSFIFFSSISHRAHTGVNLLLLLAVCAPYADDDDDSSTLVIAPSTSPIPHSVFTKRIVLLSLLFRNLAGCVWVRVRAFPEEAPNNKQNVFNADNFIKKLKCTNSFAATPLTSMRFECCSRTFTLRLGRFSTPISIHK